MKKSFIFLITLFAALALSALCLAFPVYHWASIPSSTELKILGGIAALAIGVCKLTFIPLAIENRKAKNYHAAFWLFLTAATAFTLSTLATQKLFQEMLNDKSSLKTAETLEYTELTRKLNGINTEIETMTRLIAADLNANYRKRAYVQQENLQTLKGERETTLLNLKTLSSAYSEAARDTNAKNQSNRTLEMPAVLKGSAFASIALHIACIFSVLAVTSWWPPLTTQPPQKNSAKHPTQTKPVQAASAKPQTVELSTQQLELAKRIEQGEFGNEPVLRDLIASKAIKGGFNRIKPVFAHLISNNKLIETGNGYALVQKIL